MSALFVSGALIYVGRAVLAAIGGYQPRLDQGPGHN